MLPYLTSFIDGYHTICSLQRLIGSLWTQMNQKIASSNSSKTLQPDTVLGMLSTSIRTIPVSNLTGSSMDSGVTTYATMIQ